jgi:hypothetical protein
MQDIPIDHSLLNEQPASNHHPSAQPPMPPSPPQHSIDELTDMNFAAISPQQHHEASAKAQEWMNFFQELLPFVHNLSPNKENQVRGLMLQLCELAR